MPCGLRETFRVTVCFGKRREEDVLGNRWAYRWVQQPVMSANRVDLGSFASQCWTFRRTHTSADPVRLRCTRLALPLTLSLPSRLVPNARLTVGVPPRALWLAGIFLRRNKRCVGVVGTRTDWVLKGEEGGMATPLLQYVARFDGGGRDCWVWRGRLQGELAMVLPVCRIPVSICCAKRRATSFTHHVLEGDKPVHHFPRFRPDNFLWAERCS